MKKIKFDIPYIKDKPIEIICLADVHYGNEAFDETFFTNVMDYIYRNENVYVVLNGDLIEGQTKNAPSSVFSQTTASIQEQIGWIVEKLKPIANRIISVCGGNHDSDRQMKEVGITPTDMIVSLLAQVDPTITERYCQDSSGCFDFINIGFRPKNNNRRYTTAFTLFHQHSTGGGTTKGGQVNRSVKTRDSMPPSMVVITSHVHNPEAFPTIYYDVDFSSYNIKEIEGWNVISNAFLKNGSGYATKNAMKPASRNVPIIQLKAIRVYYYENKKQSDAIRKKISIKWKSPEEFSEE